jgi:hypothetical protein
LKKLLIFGVLFLLAACATIYEDRTTKLVKTIEHQGKAYPVYATTVLRYDLYPAEHPDGKPNPGDKPVRIYTEYTVTIGGEEYACFSADDCQKVVEEETAAPTRITAAPVPEGEGGGGYP